MAEELALQPRTPDLDALFPSSPGAELPNDAPGSDRVDTALKARSQAYSQGGDLQWLTDGTFRTEPVVQDRAAFARPQAQQSAEEQENGLLGMAGAVAADIGMGLVETPRQIVGGMRDAVQSVIDFGDALNEQFPWPGTAVFDEQGNFSPRILNPDEMLAAERAGQGLTLPEIGEPSTVTGTAVRAVGQFLTGFGAAAKGIGGLSAATRTGTAARAAGAGAIADFMAFGGLEDRLSNLIQEVPALQNPISEYLAADPSDSELEGRFKNALEGLALGGLANGLFRGIKAYRALRNVARDKNAAERVSQVFRFAGEERTMREAAELRLLGTATDDAPLLEKATVALKQTETGVPIDVAAQSLTRGLTPLHGMGDVYVNFAKIQAPEDIQRIIQDTSSAFADSIDDARRGVRANAETIISADKVDAWSTLMSRRTGEPLNAEQSVAARQLWATAADKLGQVAQSATENPTPENLFQFRRMLATYHAIQKEVIGARTETARALQSWSIPVGGNLERMRDMTQALERAGGATQAETLARMFAVASKTPDAATVMGNLAEKTFFQRALGSVQEYWINALLSGPKTHIVNMMSNASVSALDTTERAIAARLGRVFLDDTGVEIGEALAQIEGLRGGIFDAFRNAGKAIRTGETGFGLNQIEGPRERMISSGTWNIRSDSWLGRGVDGLGAVVNVPGRLMQSEDEFFKTIAYRKEVHALAHRMATQELRQGKIGIDQFNARKMELVDNPPEALRMDAVTAAAYQTFTSEPGRFVRTFQQWISRAPVLKFVVPFINTPANILKYTFEHSPAAPASAKFRAAMAAGGADADLALTRMSMGTMGILAAVDWSMHGYITGSGPTDNPAEMQNWRRQGYQPYSVKIGDRWIAFNRLDPLGFTFGIGADIGEYIANAEGDDQMAAEVEEAMAVSTFAVAENTTSKSYMQGFAQLVEAISDPQRFAPQYLERFASSFVPAGVAEIARFVDPVQRQAHDVVTGFKRRLPGFSSDLPPRRDLWGREITYQSGLGATYDALSPLYGSTYKPEPIDKLMQEDGWFVGMGGFSFTVNGERVSLKNLPQAKSRFYELRGATKPSAIGADRLIDKYGDLTLLETLNAIVLGQHDLSERFRELQTPEDREDFAKGVVRDYYTAAKKQLFQEFPELTEMAERKARARAAE